MNEIETTIKGIRCVLELWEEDGEQRSSLFLFKTDPLTGDEYQGSLQLCQYEGGIPLHYGLSEEGPQVWKLSRTTFEVIEEWADAHGY